MMMIAPNSLVRQKEGTQGEEQEEEVGGRRKAGSIGTPTPGGVLDQGWRMRESGENIDGGVGFQ